MERQRESLTLYTCRNGTLCAAVVLADTVGISHAVSLFIRLIRVPIRMSFVATTLNWRIRSFHLQFIIEIRSARQIFTLLPAVFRCGVMFNNFNFKRDACHRFWLV
jgi:hypothetical protein